MKKYNKKKSKLWTIQRNNIGNEIHFEEFLETPNEEYLQSNLQFWSIPERTQETIKN